MNPESKPQPPLGQAISPKQLAFSTFTGFVALGFGSGLTPKAPGTAGSLAALVLAVPLQLLSPVWYGLVVVAAFALGVYCCEVTSRRMALQDPGAIVWDEVVSMWLVLAFVPASIGWWFGAFLLFRLFDIAKPWPIRWLDQTMKGGAGIMCDDLLAAAYAIALLVLAQRFLPFN